MTISMVEERLKTEDIWKDLRLMNEREIRYHHRLKKAIDHIEENLKEDLPLTEVSDQAAVDLVERKDGCWFLPTLRDSRCSGATPSCF